MRNAYLQGMGSSPSDRVAAMTDLSQRVRKSEAKRIAQGQKQIRLWLPDDPLIIERFRLMAQEAITNG